MHCQREEKRLSPAPLSEYVWPHFNYRRKKKPSKHVNKGNYDSWPVDVYGAMFTFNYSAATPPWIFWQWNNQGRHVFQLGVNFQLIYISRTTPPTSTAKGWIERQCLWQRWTSCYAEREMMHLKNASPLNQGSTLNESNSVPTQWREFCRQCHIACQTVWGWN